jgi:hypothetical protein
LLGSAASIFQRATRAVTREREQIFSGWLSAGGENALARFKWNSA